MRARRAAGLAVMALVCGLTVAQGLNRGLREAEASTTDVFWTDLVQSKVFKRTAGGSAATSTVLSASSTPVIASPRPIATDGTYLFVGNDDGNTVIRSAMDGSNATTLGGLANLSIQGFYTNANYLLYTRWNNGVYRAAKDGTGSVALVAAGSQGAPSGEFAGVFATADTVYFTYYGSGGGISGKVYKRSLDANGAGTGAVSLVYDSATNFDPSTAAKRTYEGIWLVGSELFLGSPAGIDIVTTSGAYQRTIGGSSAKNLAVVGGYAYFTTSGPSLKRINTDAAHGTSGTTVDASSSFTFGVTAAPSYLVTYEGNGEASGAPPASAGYQTGATATVLGNTGSLAKTHCTFVGWNTASDGTGTTYVSGDTFSVAAENVTLFAKWSCAYPVTYERRVDESGSVPVNANTYAPGATFTTPGNTGNLVKAGHQFLYWDVVSGGTRSGATVTVTGAVTMRAVWVGGPLEFAATASGPAQSTFEFPQTVQGQQSTMTVYVRNTGATAVQPQVSGNSGGISRTGGTCPVTGTQPIAPYAGNPSNACTYVFTWTASTVGIKVTLPFTVSYGLTNTFTLEGTPVSASRTPTFDTPVRTADGFTVNVTNWDASWSWVPSVSVGSVAAGSGSGSTLPLTVTGVGAGVSATVSVETTRTNYARGSGNVSSSAFNAARTPTFDTPVRTADGFTVNVTNWDASWSWVPSVSVGSVAAGSGSGSTLPLTVTGVGAGVSATVTVMSTRSGYQDGTATVAESAAQAPTTTTAAPTVGTTPGSPATENTNDSAAGGQQSPTTTVPEVVADMPAPSMSINGKAVEVALSQKDGNVSVSAGGVTIELGGGKGLVFSKKKNMDVEVSGLLPGSTVELRLGGALVGKFIVDSSGSGGVKVDLSKVGRSGRSAMEVKGRVRSGASMSMKTFVRVGEGLPTTGRGVGITTTAIWLLLGGVLLGLGRRRVR